MTRCRLALPVCGSPGGDLVGGRVGSGWPRDGGDVREDRDDRGRPGPRFSDLQPSSSLTVDEPGGDVKKPVPQRFRFACSQDLGVGGERDQAGPGDQIRRDHGQRQPRGIDAEFPRGEPSQAGVFGVPDAVLDPGMSPVPRFEERELFPVLETLFEEARP